MSINLCFIGRNAATLGLNYIYIFILEQNSWWYIGTQKSHGDNCKKCHIPFT